VLLYSLLTSCLCPLSLGSRVSSHSRSVVQCASAPFCSPVHVAVGGSVQEVVVATLPCRRSASPRILSFLSSQNLALGSVNHASVVGGRFLATDSLLITFHHFLLSDFFFFRSVSEQTVFMLCNSGPAQIKRFKS
jgi:hypothetical protein